MSTFIFLSIGGGSGTNIPVVANYNALIAAYPPPNTTHLGQFVFVENAQGTWWIPGPVLGTYYPAGLYYCNGTDWKTADVPYQATQVEVDAGTVTDKFVSPKTFNDSAQLASKQNNAIVVSSNQTAVNDGNYTVVANATFTDPSPVEGKGYRVFVRNGTATINAVAYTERTTILRLFHSGAWVSYVSVANQWTLHDVTPGAVTSGTSLTISKSILLPTFGSILKLEKITAIKTGTNAVFRMRVYLSEVDNNIGGTAIQLATAATSNSNNIYLPMERIIEDIGGNLRTIANNANQFSDITQSASRLDVAKLTGSPLYLIIAVQCDNASDSARFESAYITNY
jgi:hypothetical protein